MTVDVANVQTAIVLQGGGALGAYEFGVLRALYEQRPGFRPAAVAGISIGALTAAVLGGARDRPMTRIDSKEGSRWYWDGGLFSNTPLSPAINALEEAGGGDPSVLRELIVVELFPMEAPIPATMPDVFERMVQLQYASRLKLDEKFF